MNAITIIGRLTRDSELSYLPSVGTPKLAFTIAVDRKFQKDRNNKKVDFIPCQLLGKRAEGLCQYLTKGAQIALNGELHLDKYTNKEGQDVIFTNILVDHVEFAESKRNVTTEYTPHPESKVTNKTQEEPPAYNPSWNPGDFQVIDDDELPF